MRHLRARSPCGPMLRRPFCLRRPLSAWEPVHLPRWPLPAPVPVAGPGERCGDHKMIRAERLEQVIARANRNLQVELSRKPNGGDPFPEVDLDSIDVGVFGADRFAIEMLQFVKNSAQLNDKASPVLEKWTEQFAAAMKTLLFECVVVQDPVERDCFVGRTYSWFTEKLRERRQIPRAPVDFDTLKNSVAKMEPEQGASTEHTVRALDMAQQQQGRTNRARGIDVLQPPSPVRAGGVPSNAVGALGQPETPGGDGGTPLLSISGMAVGAGVVPPVVRDVFEGDVQRNAALQGKNAYGFKTYQPTSAAEKQMYEMWLSRRREEAYRKKAEEQVSLTVDRWAMNKSRMEAEALRRTESGRLSSQGQRAPSRASSRGGADSRPPSGAGGERSRYATAQARPGSSASVRGGSAAGGRRDLSPPPRPASQGHVRQDLDVLSPSNAYQPYQWLAGSQSGRPHSPAQEEVIPQASRKTRRSPQRGVVPTLPMKFKHSYPKEYLDRFAGADDAEGAKNDAEGFDARVRFAEEHELRAAGQSHAGVAGLMDELSDEEDEEEEMKELSRRIVSASAPPGGAPSGGGGSGGNGRGGGTRGAAPAPVTEEEAKSLFGPRPTSARRFKEFAYQDAEVAVHYKQLSGRRMPITPRTAEVVIRHRREEQKQLDEIAAKRQEAAEKKASKGKGKDSAKPAGGAKKAGKKDKAAAAAAAAAEAEAKAKAAPQYASAQEFMETHFPNLDEDAHGLVRSDQEWQCDVVRSRLSRAGFTCSDRALQRALLIPQDRPVEVCAIAMPVTGETIAPNPLPPTMWRSYGGGKKKKKGKGKKKKK